MLEITFLSIGCADAVHIRYYGTDDKWHNILIDGGRACTYIDKVQPVLAKISKDGECIDIWVITHIDDDHIGALLYALEYDQQTLLQCNFFNSKIWYNYNKDDDYTLRLKCNDLKSVSQGVKLVDLLSDNGVAVIDSITNTSDATSYFGANMTILSPNQEYYNKFIYNWQTKQISMQRNVDIMYKASHVNDYKVPYRELALRPYSEDNSVWNKCSIAILFEVFGYNFIFTADSSANTLYDSLSQLGYSIDNKINLEFLQLPHHGSRYNISTELLSIIECNNFIVSANAINKHNLPHKEALSRIIYANNKNSTNFHFTANNETLRSIFSSDNFSDIINTKLNFTNLNIKISIEDGKIIYSTNINN